MEEAEEDPVVREIPVHLTNEACRNLFMVQFPLRPTYRPLPEPPRRARVKPINQMMQLDFAVDQRSGHFDPDAEDYLKQTHLRMQSAHVPALTNYVVGVFRQGQLHLTRLSSVVQMRPSLSHIDDAVNEDEKDMEVEAKREPPSTEMKEVQFQFKKKQSERAISAIQNSYAYKKQQIDAENWIELQVYDKKSAGAADEFESLFSEKEEEVVSTMTSDEYIKAMQYRSMAAVDKPRASTNPAPTNDEDEEQEDEINGACDWTAASCSSQHEARKSYWRHSSMWVCMCEGACFLLAPWCAAERRQCAARNDIIKALAKTPSGVLRMELVENFSVDAGVAKTILTEFATLEPKTRKWSFRIDHDDTFTKRFPAVAKTIKL
ncbi:unnamed protein product [Peronospora destructor]|uniref:Sin1 middle CRIM domain-containing protein n=1 Tax=Peronospora destructor TaxID=86335 RepID=A0AAV0UZB1_9STRA|nr:unnamed protein product [Peronospora destructor]